MSYKSPNSGKDCTPAQLIAEILVGRKFKGRSLPQKFWNLPEFKKDYRLAIISANTVLKIYEPQVILRALNRKDCDWCYSLRTEILQSAFKQEQNKINAEKKAIREAKKIVVNVTDEFRQVSSGEKSLKSKLD